MEENKVPGKEQAAEGLNMTRDNQTTYRAVDGSKNHPNYYSVLAFAILVFMDKGTLERCLGCMVGDIGLWTDIK